MKNIIPNTNHLQLLGELEKHSGEGTPMQKDRHTRYMGTTKFSYLIKTAVKVNIVKKWIFNHKDISKGEYVELLNSLYVGKSHDERALAGKLLEFLPKLRKQINPWLLKEWLSEAQGWAEVDSLCQSNFTAEEMLGNWEVWKKMMSQFSLDKNIHIRRASLVLLTGPVRKSSDIKLSELAFKNIKQLTKEKNILITKAISWLLRALTKQHREEVIRYIKENEENLPKIAVRETTRKIQTGRK